MERKTGNQRLCGRRKCKNAFRASDWFGRYFEGSKGVGRQDVILDARNPIKQGISLPLETGIRYRLWGPKLTDQQIHLATLGWKPERRKPGKSITVNLIGGYRFPGAPAIKLRAIELEPEPIAPALPVVPSVPLVPDDADPLAIPAFLMRPIAEAAESVDGGRSVLCITVEARPICCHPHLHQRADHAHHRPTDRPRERNRPSERTAARQWRRIAEVEQ